MPSLSEGRVQALQQAVWDACSEAFSEEEPSTDKKPNDPRQLILRVVYPVLKKFTLQRNARKSATAQLPHELLCAVFVLLPFEDRIACSHVCHHWREISLANPAKLWDFIPSDDRPNVMWDLLERADEVPVTLERVKITNDRNGLAIGRMLAQHMDHIRSLLIELPTRDDYEGTPESIHDALQMRAPLLEKFAVIDKHMDGFDLCEEFWSDMFASDAPRLREIKLFGLSFDVLPTTFASTSVRKLYLGSNGSAVTLDRVHEAFSLFPQLEELGLEISSSFARDLGVPNTAAPVDPPRTLRRLVINFNSVSAAMTYSHSYIRHTEIAEVEICFPRSGDWVHTISATQMFALYCGPPGDVVSLETGIARLKDYHELQTPFVSLVDPRGRSRKFRGLSLEMMQAGTYSRLATLGIHIVQLAEHAERRVFTALPVLAQLSITCAESSDDHSIHSIIDEGRYSHWALECPLLAKVALCTPVPEKKWAARVSVDAAEVVQLLRACLRFSAERLAVLAFCGMGVELASEDPLSTLHTLAQDVVLDQPGPDLAWARQPALDWS